MSLFKKRRRDYHGMNYHVDPKRQRKQERSSRWQKFLNRVYSVIILGALIWLAYFILFTQIFEIREIELIDGREIEHQKIMGTVNNFLNNKKYKFFSKRNFFVLDKLALEQGLREEFFLSELVIKKDFPNKLIIEFEERASSFNLCLGAKCFRVDYLGNVIAEIEGDGLGEGVLLVHYKNEEIKKLEIEKLGDELEVLEGVNFENDEDTKKQEFPKITPGVTEIPEEKVMAILDLYEIMNKSGGGVAIESMEIYDFDGLAKKIIVNTKNGFKVFFNEEKDFLEQVDNLTLILNREIKLNINNIEYIDLRFGNKIYYK